MRPIADEMGLVPPLPCTPATVTVTGPPISEVSATLSDQNCAELMQNDGCPEGQSVATHVTEGEATSTTATGDPADSQVTPMTTDGTNEQGSTPCGIEPSEKRVKGVEPSTFTLAT